MGSAQDALDAATVAPTGFETWAGIVSNQSDAAGAVSATAEGMDPANSAAVNTTAFNAAITKAGRNGKVVFDKSGTYQINAAIAVPYAGITIEGANSTFVRIQQVTANTNGFELAADPNFDFTYAINITLRGLRISGPGGGTTGIGLRTEDPAGSNRGAKLTLEHVRFDGWDIGARIIRFDNTFVRDIHFQSCRIGMQTSGNANTIHIVNGTASTISECAYVFGDGFGVTFHAADIINCAKMIRVLNGAQVTIIGGNFETCTGTEGHIDIEAGASVIAIGNRFLKGTVETPCYRLALASLIAVAPIQSGFTTAPIVKKITDTAVSVVFSPSTNISGTDRLLQTSDAALATLGHSQFINRNDNAVPAAAVQYRGLVLHKVTRDAVSAEDALYWYGKDRSGGSDVYTQRVMTNVIEGTGTPEGAVTARVGTLYARRDGGTDTSLYVKSSGTANTGWRAVTTAAP